MNIHTNPSTSVMLRHRSRSCCLLLVLSTFLDGSGSFRLLPGPAIRTLRGQRRPDTKNEHQQGVARTMRSSSSSRWAWAPPTSRIRPSRIATGLLMAAASRNGGGSGSKRRGGSPPSGGRPTSRSKHSKKSGPPEKGPGARAGGGRSHRRNSVVVSTAAASSGKPPPTASGGDLRDDASAPHSAPPPPESKRNQRSPPPWQVMSDKDAKRNVAKELERRRLIKEGVKAAHETLDDGENGGSALKARLSSSLLSDRDRQFLKWRPGLLSRSTSFSSARKALALRAVGSYLGSSSNIPELGVPEVAFLGRSNVGKSSLLNRLVDGVVSGAPDSAVARVGKTPGATASVNLYAIHDGASAAKGGVGSRRRDVLGLCDLPGFGYAKLSKDVQESVQLAAERYLSKRRHLALGVLLVDIRRTPSDDDRAVLAALYDMGVPLLVVATKLDKLTSTRQREDSLEEIRDGLGLPPNQPLAVSTVSGEGCRDLWKIILEACEGAVQEFGAKYDVGGVPSDVNSSGAHRAGSSEVVEHDDDDDEIAYSQGYDWIHDDQGGAFYEGDDSDGYDDDDA